MKKTLFSIWALMACACNLMAQSSPLDYYRKVNQAELAICDSNLKAANKYYKEAFTINPSKPFSVDLRNAFFAAMDVKDYPTAEKYLSQLLSRGIGKYMSKRILGSYKGEQRSQIETMLAKYPNDTTVKNPMAIRIRQMIDWDQDVRKYFGELSKNGDYMVDSTYNVDYMNAKELLEMFQKEGVPNETVLGSGDASPDYDILIKHHNGGEYGNKPSHWFDTMLLKAIYTWDYDPRSFTNTVGWSPKFQSLQYKDITIHFPYTIDCLYYEDLAYPAYLEPAKEKRMNEDRAKIGLPSLDDLRKKILAENKGKAKGSFLSKYSLTENLRFLDTESEKDYKEWVSENKKHQQKASAQKN